MNGVIQVLLVGDDEMVIERLSQMLSAEEEITVIGRVKAAKDALAEAKRLSPDLILMATEGGKPVMKAIDATRAITKARLPAKVVIFTDDLHQYLAPAIKAGAVGILSNNISRDELMSALQRIQQWFPSSS